MDEIQAALQAELTQEEQRMTEKQDTPLLTDGSKSMAFPFTLDDLQYFIIKKAGLTVKVMIKGREAFDQERNGSKKGNGTYHKPTPTAGFGSSGAYSYGDWCKHDPAQLPIFTGTNAKGNEINLFAADAMGARIHYNEFDFLIDGGDVVSLYHPKSLFAGDQALALALDPYTTAMVKPDKCRVLKICWADRKAPDVVPEFWPALAGLVQGRVLACCQGGHGRTGTTIVCLMMVLSDYDALDAITHLRAIHCARAIESKIQHEYINSVAKFLGREANALKAEEVKSFRMRFLTLENPIAKPYQDRLLAKGEK